MQAGPTTDRLGTDSPRKRVAAQAFLTSGYGDRCICARRRKNPVGPALARPTALYIWRDRDAQSARSGRRAILRPGGGRAQDAQDRQDRRDWDWLDGRPSISRRHLAARATILTTLAGGRKMVEMVKTVGAGWSRWSRWWAQGGGDGQDGRDGGAQGGRDGRDGRDRQDSDTPAAGPSKVWTMLRIRVACATLSHFEPH